MAVKYLWYKPHDYAPLCLLYIVRNRETSPALTNVSIAMTLRFHYKQTEIDAMPTLPTRVPWLTWVITVKTCLDYSSVTVVTMMRHRMLIVNTQPCAALAVPLRFAAGPGWWQRRARANLHGSQLTVRFHCHGKVTGYEWSNNHTIKANLYCTLLFINETSFCNTWPWIQITLGRPISWTLGCAARAELRAGPGQVRAITGPRCCVPTQPSMEKLEN